MPEFHDASRKVHLKFPTEQKYDLDHTVLIYTRETWKVDGSKLNRSIDKMMNSAQPTKWKGPVFAFSLPGTPDDPSWFQDFQLGDIRVAADFFRFHEGGQGWEPTAHGLVTLTRAALHDFLDSGGFGNTSWLTPAAFEQLVQNLTR